MHDQLTNQFLKTKGFSNKLKIVIEFILQEEQQAQPGFTWENFPWQVQFLPLYVHFFLNIGKASAINPGIDGMSGMVGAQKNDINKNIPKKYKTKSIIIEIQKDNFDTVSQKIKKQKIGFPLYAKPNQGERAADVKFVQNKTELEQYYERSTGDFLVEEPITLQKEFCVSVEKQLAGNFEVTSLVERRSPIVIGDGKTTIRDLIKKLPLAETQYNKLIASHSPIYLAQILPENQSEPVVKAASISLGTQIIDLSSEIFPQIEAAINEVLKSISGFNIGRFDLKADSITDIATGNFKVIELNGAAGVPMHVYTDRPIAEKYDILEKYFNSVQKAAEREIKAGTKPCGFWNTFRYFTQATKHQVRSDIVKKLERQYLKRIAKKFIQLEFKRYFS